MEKIDWYSIYDLALYSTKHAIETSIVGIHDYLCSPYEFTKVVFTNCKVLIINVCHRNWIYYNLTKHKFPMVEKIYIVCPPCNEAILSRFDCEIYIYSNYSKKQLPHVKEMNIEFRNQLLNEIKLE